MAAAGESSEPLLTRDEPQQHRPSPFDDHPAAASADVGNDSRHLAWEAACEEAGEAPAFATAFSSTMDSYRLSHRQLSLGEADVGGLKAADAACGAGAWRDEVVRLIALAFPIALTNLAGFVSSAVGVSFVGRLGGQQLSTAVLSMSIFNVTGLSAIMGFTGAIDTLCGQAWGARNYRSVGVVLQRALLVNLAFAGVISIAWLRSERLFLALGQEAELAAAAARYMSLLAPALPCMGVTEACKRVLLAQGVARPSSVATGIGAGLSPLFNWFFIVHLKLGLDGAALAVVALQATAMILLGGYTVLRNISLRGTEQATWHGWTWEAVQEWGPYIRIAIPSVVLICAKWWSFEALILMAGWFPDAKTAVAAMGVCSMANSVAFMAVFGISMSASVRISQSLGANCPRAARRATFTALALTMTVLVALVSALLGMQDRWVLLLTDVAPVIKAVLALCPIFAISMLFDGVYTALVSVLRGSGKQTVGAFTNIACYWLLAVPLAYHLAFPLGWGLTGLWVGAATANALQAAIILTFALRFDYRGEAAKAAARFALHRPLLVGSGEEHA